jgi:hypothetical protein
MQKEVKYMQFKKNLFPIVILSLALSNIPNLAKANFPENQKQITAEEQASQVVAVYKLDEKSFDTPANLMKMIDDITEQFESSLAKKGINTEALRPLVNATVWSLFRDESIREEITFIGLKICIEHQGIGVVPLS